MLQTVAVRRSLSRLAADEPFVCHSCLFRVLTRNVSSPRPFSLNTRSSDNARQRESGRSRNGISRNPRHTRRHFSSSELISRTAIDAASPVPPRYRALHSELLRLLESANGYVDVSCVQLALRSLETETPTIRVALLGLGDNGTKAARKLARAILTDVLSEEQRWEKEMDMSATDGRALLLRYGEYEDEVESSSVLQTISLPSEFLKRHNLEILVTSMNAGNQPAQEDAQATLAASVLVPSLATPTATNSRVVFIRYPVHKTVVVAEGIQGAIDYGRFPQSIRQDELVRPAISVPLHSTSAAPSAEESVTENVIDVDLALQGLNLFRASDKNGVDYSRCWDTSRIGSITKWIAEGQSVSSHSLPSVIQKSIASVLAQTATAIAEADEEIRSIHMSSLVSETRRSEIQQAIKTWSASAHTDLQYNLEVAFASRSWKRTAWFRLPWRIDDVSASLGDILRLQWLTEAEQTLAFLSGRVTELGLATTDEMKNVASSIVDDADSSTAAAQSSPTSTTSTSPLSKLGAGQSESEKDLQLVAEENENHVDRDATARLDLERANANYTLVEAPTKLSRLLHDQDRGQDQPFINGSRSKGQVQQRSSADRSAFDPPWPHTISRNRSRILSHIIPEMHRKAQALLLGSLSTAGGTTALATWIGVASSGSMIYEAGAVAALGLVWSMRRLQKAWGAEQAEFTTTLREDGRRVLMEIETHLNKIAGQGGRVVEDVDDVKALARAKSVLDKCRRTLDKLE